VRTAGRAVLTAGTTVVIGMLGLLVLRQPLLNGVAIAAAATVAMTVIAALTLLPALLSFTGTRLARPSRRSTFLGGKVFGRYAGNVHVAQGRTVDTAHLLVTGSLSRQALYVGITRGRQANTAHVVTGQTAPPGREPYPQAAPESVLADVLQRQANDLSATEQIRQAQDWTGGTGHLLTL
jgi:hypothetical protein